MFDYTVLVKYFYSFVHSWWCEFYIIRVFSRMF